MPLQTDLEADRQVANTLAELIIGGSLASVLLGTEPEVTNDEDETDDDEGDRADEDPAA